MALLTDLHYELLSYIMIFMVQSPDGAADLARTLSVCRSFSNFAYDEHILKAVAFCDLRITSRYQLFQQINGLLNRCAVAGNVVAQFLLAKTILLSTTDLLASERKTVGRILGQDKGKIPTGDTQVGSFILHFMPDIASTAESSSQRLPHYELVKLFLCVCSPQCLAEMGVHLTHYIDYFTGFGNPESFNMHKAVYQMCVRANQIMTLQEVKEIRERVDAYFRFVKERQREARQRQSATVATLIQFPGTAPEARERGESSYEQRSHMVAPLGQYPGTALEARERGESSSGQGRRYELVFMKIIRTFGTEIFRGNHDTVVVGRYLEKVMELFEECRTNAFTAFSDYFT